MADDLSPVGSPMSDSESVDVVVIGAGISGLETARRVLDEGLTVRVFESRDRVGGRLHSPALRSGDGHVDLGATWFWPGERRVAELVRQHGIATHDHFLAGDAMYHERPRSQRMSGNPMDVPSWRFTNGAQSLATAVAEDLPPGAIRLETKVDAVCEAGRSLIVQHTGGQAVADHVVVALPPSLAMQRLRFEPELPERLAGLAAATPVWMGAITKVVIHYRRPFWRDAGLSGSAISHLGPIRELHDMSGPDAKPAVLFGFVPNQASDEPITRDQVRSQLVEMFGPDASDPEEILIADWRAEPDTSPPGVERLSLYQTYGHPTFQSAALDGRLHWASTETSPVAPGHIEGALAAAERTAAAIISTQTGSHHREEAVR